MVASDGTSTEELLGLAPGIYDVGVTIVGGYFATSQALVVGDIDATPALAEAESAISFSAPFIHHDYEGTHSAVWDWGDGHQCDTSLDSECSLNEPSGPASGTVMGSHSYLEAGVYTVSLLITDLQGNSDGSLFQYIVVHEPTVGFVTGGGWIDSPEGACRYDACDDDTTGKANSGFVSKYDWGAQRLTGETEFRFKAGNLHFYSDTYDWLVVAGHKAMFKGVGTINGEGDFGFLLSAIDADLAQNTEVDLFRIKIWDRANGDLVVYDNQMDVPEDDDPTTVIGGGSIVIHKAN
jgi:hypothetical protein